MNRRYRPLLFLRDHPYLAGVQVEGGEWSVGKYALREFSGVTVVGKQDEWCTLGYVPVGRGRLIFSAYGIYDSRADRDRDALMQIYRNIVKAANPLTERDEARALLTRAAPSQEIVFWQRDWAGYSARRLTWRPYGPRPDEVMESLNVASVRGEIDTHFFCLHPTTDLGEVTIHCQPLHDPDGNPAPRGGITVLVMGLAPEVPVPKTSQHYGKVDPSQRGPFFLIPPESLEPIGKPAFRVEPCEPPTVWILVSTKGLAAGEYTSRIDFSVPDGRTVASLPIRLTVAPIQMSAPRLVKLRTWGGGIGDFPPLVREMHRQGCDDGAMSRHAYDQVKLRNSNSTFDNAYRHPKDLVRDKKPIPKLDFSPAWRERIDLYLAHGITNLVLYDTHAGRDWAGAVTGAQCDLTRPFEDWPPKWRAAFVDYYRQAQEYISERGYLMFYPRWTDEVSRTHVVRDYLPLAKAYMQAGMGPGTNFSVYGFMSPEMVNEFAPWTRCWSIYEYGYSNFQRFLREGSVTLPQHSVVGTTRGAHGLVMRQPHHLSRVTGWMVVHQGSPMEFLRGGPIWRGDDSYYVDYDKVSMSIRGGVQGERLLAYGSSDPQDTSVDVLTSSDWEGLRDGVDDANLARMVQWYLPRLKARATGAWQKRLHVIETEISKWFTPESPFPLHEEPVHYKRKPEGSPLLEYHFTIARANSTRDMIIAKRYMIDLLKEMASYTGRQDVQVFWHAWRLVRDGRAVATIVISPDASPTVKRAANHIVNTIATQTGVRLPINETDDFDSLSGTKVLVGEANDKPVTTLAKQLPMQLDVNYPGAGDYRIKRLTDSKTIAILGVDGSGVERGVRNWCAFLNPQGHWLLAETED